MADLGQSRRASGAANAAARQAIQTANTAERRSSSFQDDLNSLIRPEKKAAQLRAIEPRGTLPAQRGSAPYVAKPSTGATGGGIASPLTEKTKAVEGGTAPDREYYESGFRSSDGLFILPAIKTQNMTDANGAEVVFQFADPEGSA